MTEWLTNNDVQVKKDEERLKKRGALYPQLIDVAEESGDEYWDWEDGSRTHAKAVMDILDVARQEYLEKCYPKEPCNCEECKWFQKWFGNGDLK